MGKCGNWEKWGCEGKGKLLRPSRLLFPPGGNFPFPFFRHSVCFFALAARGKEAFAKVQNTFSLETEAKIPKKNQKFLSSLQYTIQYILLSCWGIPHLSKLLPSLAIFPPPIASISSTYLSLRRQMEGRECTEYDGLWPWCTCRFPKYVL